MSFQFKPRFNATRLTSKVNRYMARGSAQDWVFDACNDTTCPVIYGTKYNYYSSKKYIENLPVGNYTYKWELFDKNDYHNMCCVQVIVAVGQENISPNIHNATDNETDYTYDPQHS
ncbi:MD-2-related lipid-recognition protein-like [Pectinophora gossypiella]|uniref:MD-2-related lipid-recognition protein-like n=1 Tax=Pectinophora gossypiella TaxID=13191 RepID=UPI00214F5C51|nr:MD-2-related lipid-recognition protein-like [Pectinophora gossypiella]